MAGGTASLEGAGDPHTQKGDVAEGLRGWQDVDRGGQHDQAWRHQQATLLEGLRGHISANKISLKFLIAWSTQSSQPSQP